MPKADHVVEQLGNARRGLKTLRSHFGDGPDQSEYTQARARDCSIAITHVETAMFYAHGFNKLFSGADLSESETGEVPSAIQQGEKPPA